MKPLLLLAVMAVMTIATTAVAQTEKTKNGKSTSGFLAPIDDETQPGDSNPTGSLDEALALPPYDPQAPQRVSVEKQAAIYMHMAEIGVAWISSGLNEGASGYLVCENVRTLQLTVEALNVRPVFVEARKQNVSLLKSVLSAAGNGLDQLVGLCKDGELTPQEYALAKKIARKMAYVMQLE